ncbi:hypothetical protein [Streptomyces albipurpureus]|uniref:Uncharacterized protein n=1 Tax=Streptomyces albipurpureus TaxID=2897419 RepID=A0ABT0UNH8_9ACTN|nr:hypothetical protein [Streptomyces sp. CWNU-1]MCM2390163.1 hypothetical protein [Streptomyces sp. CWNU-1]
MTACPWWVPWGLLGAAITLTVLVISCAVIAIGRGLGRAVRRARQTTPEGSAERPPAPTATAPR